MTAAGSSAAAHPIVGRDVRTPVLFVAIVMGTGPPLLGPVLKRFRLDHQARTVLESMGILMDPVPSSAAVVTLHAVTAPDVSRVVVDDLLHVPGQWLPGAAG